jgi:hypothetical protein
MWEEPTLFTVRHFLLDQLGAELEFADTASTYGLLAFTFRALK